MNGILFYRKCADLFSDGTFKKGMSVKMNKGSKYTSVLRAWEPLPGDDRKYDEILDLCKKHPNAFDSVLFFTQNNHSVRNPETHRATAKRLRPMLERFNAAGIPSGIDVLCTIGFFEDGLDPIMESESYPHYVSVSGSVTAGRLCPEYAVNREYIAEQYRIYAELHPDRIYIDDDISSMSCFCPACIRRFAREYGVLDEPCATRDALIALFEDKDRNVRKTVRDKWIDFNAKRINEVFELIEKAMHGVDPRIGLGFMSHVAGTDGLENELWAETLRGKEAQRVSWRPGGGAYTEFSSGEVLDKALRLSAQIRYLPPFADRVESEIENYPYHSLRKSPGFTAFESLVYLAAGCTGTTFNVCEASSFAAQETEPFFKMAEEVRRAGETVVKAMGRAPSKGVGFPWNRRTAADPASAGWRPGANGGVPFPNEFASIGLPVADRFESTSVFLLNGGIACQLTEHEIRTVLAKGVLMDADALEILCEKGYEKYLGFKASDKFYKQTYGRDLEHPLNYPGKILRDVRQSFGYCGAVTAFTKTNEKAEYLAEAVDFNGKHRGMCSGIFENELGGRIAVDGLMPFSWACALPRNQGIKKLLRWLSRDTLGVFVRSYHRISVWQRGNGIFLANFEMETACGVQIAVLDAPEQLNCVLFEGGRMRLNTVLTASETEDAYKLFELPKMPITGEILLY